MRVRRTRKVATLVLGLVLAIQAWAQPVVEAGGTDLVIVMDRSGSMRNTDPRGISKALAHYLLDQLELAGDGNRAAVVPFATDVDSSGAALTGNFDDLRKFISEIPAPAGQTDLEMALKRSYKLLAPLGDGRRKQVVCLTDGRPEPNPADQDRFPDVADAFAKRVRGVSNGTREYRRLLEEYSQKAVQRTIQNIETVVLPNFEGQIEVYPIALGSRGTDPEFLKRLAVRTTRQAEAFTLVEDAEELVLAAERIAHKGSQSLLLLRERVDATKTEHSTVFVVDPHLTKARVVLAFLEDDVQPDDFDVTLTAPNGETYRRTNARYLGARDRDGKGGLVFERFFLDGVEKGRWRIDLKSRRATKLLPRFELLVEGRTNLTLALEANPGEVQVPGPVEVRAMLGDPAGNPVAVARATGEVRDVNGRVLPIPFSIEAGGVAVGRVDLPAQPVGDYLVTARAFIRESDPTGVSGRTLFGTKPLAPVTLGLVIPYGTSQSDIEEGGFSLNREKLVFPPVGDQLISATIKSITVENMSRQPASISLKVGPISNKNGDFVDPTEWFTLVPARGVTSRMQSFNFDLKLQVPARVPASTANGLYSGSLYVSSPETGLGLDVPLEFTLNIPDIELADAKIAETGIGLSLWWRRPGQVSSDFDIRTTSASPQKVKVSISPYLTNGDGETMAPEKLRLVAADGFEANVLMEPGLESAIPMVAIAGVEDLSPGEYLGEVFVDGERARDLVVPVAISVPSWQGIWFGRWGALVLGAICIGLMLFLLALLSQRRGQFPNQSWEFRRGRDFEGDSVTVGNIFALTYDAASDGYRIRESGMSVAVSSAGEPRELPCTLAAGDKIRAGRYHLRVRTMSPNRFVMRTIESAYSRHLPSIVFLGLLGAVALTAAYWWTFN